MADEIKPGKDTSEFWLTKVVVYAGMALTAVGGIAEIINQVGTVFPGSMWIGKAAFIAGLVLTLTKSLSYTLARTLLKQTAATNKPPTLEEAAKELESLGDSK